MKVIVVGAGPTGLAAALFCSARGHEVRIVEKASARTRFSKAFGVNPRTLELLQGCGVTERFLANGWRMSALNVWRNGRHVVRSDISALEHRFNFMLIQSQSDSERILAEVLEERGVMVERDKQVRAVEVAGDRVRVQVAGAAEEELEGQVLLGADGSKSVVRTEVGIPFQGAGADDSWQLFDVEILDLPVARDEAHIFMLDRGAMFMVRIHGDMWRVLGNEPELLDHLPGRARPGRIEWRSEFGLAQKVAARFSHAGRVFLAGDAAHIHAGLGARGMNLGIEDAWIFADRLDAGRLDSYSDDRRRVVLPLVRRIHRITDMMRGRSVPAQAMRWLLPALGPLFLPLALPSLRRFVTGLDHPVERTAP